MAPAIGRHHAEWLSLVETSGPFLSVPVLSRVLPQGLDAPDSDVTARLRSARDQLSDDPALHRSWCDFVLREVLDLSDALATGAQIPSRLEHRMPEHGDTVRPDFVVVDHAEGAPKPAMHVTIHGSGQRLDRRIPEAAWSASPIDRLATLCRATGVSLGLTTNGRSWALVSARPGETTGVCTWNADLWLEEPITLRAFRTLLGAHRFFSVAEDDTLPVLLEQSARNQQEVTDRLGAQVRQAVELLIDALDRADHERKGELLGEIPNETLYRASVMMMMRLVFLFVAEERRLLPLDDPFYAESYAASTLREQLEERATRFGEDPLERSSAAWCRLLALSRGVHAGIDHEALRLPAYGGGLFDPDRYPFLEGRRNGTEWQNDVAAPLPVDDRTVLHLLTALQVLTEPGHAGQPPTSVRLSFRALDVEQIGHVYEGLLDHTAVRTFDAALGLVGRPEAELALTRVEEARAEGEDSLLELLKIETAKTPAAIHKALVATPDSDRVAKLLAACDNDAELRDRVLPFLALMRDDLRGNPRVFLPGALYVTVAGERRASGTYYTPRSLAEGVVRHALDPLAYMPGPAHEADPSAWKLRSANELLDLKVADIAMGSGAFLVAACRYLAARVLDAWAVEHVVTEPEIFDVQQERRPERLPDDPLEREALAHRLVAERCLYGVDRNPMAVEMAKLSLWLVTLAKDRPFSFLDHALCEGDSLLGVTDLKQIEYFHPDPAAGAKLHGTFFDYTGACGSAIDESLRKRQVLESFTVNDVRDAERKEQLHREASHALERTRLLGDLVIGAALTSAGHGVRALNGGLASVEQDVAELLDRDRSTAERGVAGGHLRTRASQWLGSSRSPLEMDPRCFHWPLELPEVFLEGRGGFDAVVGNPPFLGGTRITSVLGEQMNSYYAVTFPPFSRRVDLCAIFFRRAAALLASDGAVGLLATNTMSQSTTRRGGLDLLVSQGFTIYRAIKSFRWPGSALVEAATVWLTTANWSGEFTLEGIAVPAISSLLEPDTPGGRLPEKLVANRQQCFNGSRVWGEKDGFYLTAAEAQDFLASDPKNEDVIRPCMNGSDLNGSPNLKTSRWIIDFKDRSEEEAREYLDVYRRLEATVKPWRIELDPRKYGRIVAAWWKYFHPRNDLYGGIKRLGLRRVLVRARVSDNHMLAFLPNDWVYMDKLVVFLRDDWESFAVLQSSFHDAWARQYSSTLRTDISYLPTDAFETFPWPVVEGSRVATVAETYYATRRGVMTRHAEGLTKTYNRFHESKEISEDVVELRRLHIELDQAVRDAYGWTDLNLAHGFHDTRQGVRFTVNPIARREILARLLGLNLKRSATDAPARGRASLNAAGKTAATASAQQTTMFGND